jgi:two-component system, OmpR family, phosphate regulon response regulator PhoB
MSSRGKILIVEDDPPLAELLQWNMAQAGFDTVQTSDGEEALLLIEEERPDLVILDWMIESLSGIEVCRRIRRMNEFASLPVIMLTARSAEDDRLRGLETGADDYVTKPFSPAELVMRVKAVLRRTRPAITGETLTAGSIIMDTSAYSVSREGKPVELGPTEYRLLRYFLERPGRVLSRMQLLDGVWGRDHDIELRTVDVHVRRLRAAINFDGHKDVIRTVRAAGYSFDPN